MKTDLLVLGTGVTGRLVAKYLQNHPDRGTFTFAIAGRSEKKLRALVLELGLSKDVGIHVVDVLNDEQVEATVKTSKVVLNTVGPYWLYGSPVVAACARNGVHHVDVSGETHWIRSIITEFDHLATKTGSIIVPSCANVSLPADIVTYLGHKTIQSLDPHQPAHISKSTTAAKLIVTAFSGGSIATMYAEIESVPPPFLAISKENYSLSPISGPPADPSKLVHKLHIPHSKETIIGGTYFAEGADTRIVQRTWGLLELDAVQSKTSAATNARYGPTFSYEQFESTEGWAKALLLSLALLLISAILPILIRSPVGFVVKRFLPKPGDGPKDENLHHGGIDFLNITSSSSGDLHAKTTFKAKGNGYYLSAVMISECALALLRPESLTPLAAKGGVLTPATAFPDEVVRRLNRSGSGFRIESVVLEEGGEKRKRD